ncbi:flippase [Desulfonatronum thiodismutans]|uniref:flippase n=1 Tax=Desulfonatronum thiodismutans TaxID=159290 RepID=UPI00190FB4C0|nr:flippase [Desulfonatronum thiodismutans]
MHERIAHRTGLLKILDNIGWLFFDKILRMGVGLLVGVWVARYLGPEQFGLLSFALAFIGLFGAVATLGLHGIVVRDIVQDQTSGNETLGTAFVLQLLGGLTAYLLVFATISYFRPDDDLTRTIVAILGFTLVLRAGETIKYWFESQVQSKFVVWVENTTFLLIAGIKVAMILTHAPLTAFAWAILAEAALVAASLLVVYSRTSRRLHAWKPGMRRAKTLLRDSWPLILSGMAVMIYMRIDQIMLGQMIGDEAVGIYSAAVRVSEVWYFIPMAITASVFPSILEAKKRSEELYYQRLQKLFDLMAWISVAIALPMTFLSSHLIVILFGQAYEQAGAVLTIHIWAAVFVFLGAASSRWFLAENRQILSMQRSLLGAGMNVGLNILLIPRFGATGAAYATVVSYFFVVLVSDLFKKETRILFNMKSYSLFPFARFLISKR